MKGVSSGFLAALLAAGVFAQEPRVTNARVETRSAASGLEPAFNAIVAAQVGPEWIGYAVPIVKGDHRMC